MTFFLGRCALRGSFCSRKTTLYAEEITMRSKKEENLNVNVGIDEVSKGNKEVILDKVLKVSMFGERTLSVPCFSKDNPLLAKTNRNYVFNREVLSAFINFLDKPYGDALYLQGPSGCGKTSILSQAASLLDWPILQLTLNGHFEVNDLIGHLTVIDDKVTFVHGPLARALKYGYILVLNEIDLADPAELAGLNDVLEGRALVVIQNDGEVIEPHPNFRLVVTANTNGSGDYRKFCGTKTLNSAFLDRFRFVQCSFIEAKEELKILERVAPELSTHTRSMMQKVAHEIRQAHLVISHTHLHMSVPMSTRALLRWARLTVMYKGSIDPVNMALRHAFTGRLSEDECTYAHRLCHDLTKDTEAIFVE